MHGSFRYLGKILVFCATTLLGSYALADSVIPVPIRPRPILSPAAPTLDAKAYILIDANSGKVLAEKNADERLPPASLTKLMTMYVISDALKQGVIHSGDKVRISEKAWKTGGSRMFLRVNDEVPVQDLLKGIVIASGNDAAVAMSEYIAGTESGFAEIMNREAQQLGMVNSHFVDSNGLPDPNHYSTARDLALLSSAIIRNFPEDYRLYSDKWFAWNNIRQPNRNRLLWHMPEADGLKTGHTSAAGFCLVGSAKKDNTRLVSVVMGAANDSARTEDSIRLLTYGFRFFETQKFSPRAVARVWKGKQKEVAIGLARGGDFYVTIPAGQSKNTHVNMQINEVHAPIQKGEAVGAITVTLNDQVLATAPLVAMESVNKGSLWHNMADSISFGMHKLFSHHEEQANNG